MKHIKNFQLYENGDKIVSMNLYMDTQNAYPFSIDKKNNNLYVGVESTTHSENIFNKTINKTYSFMDAPEEENHDDDLVWLNELNFKGRVWHDSKMLSFWDYPKTKEELDNILDKLSKHFHKDFSDWKIQIFKNNEETFVPVSEYVGSDDASDEDYNTHLMDSEAKKKLLMSRGYRAKQHTWPRHLMPFEAHSLLETNNFKEKIKEYLWDDKYLYHFTLDDNLDGIFDGGLIPRAEPNSFYNDANEGVCLTSNSSFYKTNLPGEFMNILDTHLDSDGKFISEHPFTRLKIDITSLDYSKFVADDDYLPKQGESKEESALGSLYSGYGITYLGVIDNLCIVEETKDFPW